MVWEDQVINLTILLVNIHNLINVKVNNKYLHFKPTSNSNNTYIVQHGIYRIYNLSQSASITSYSKASNVPTI